LLTSVQIQPVIHGTFKFKDLSLAYETVERGHLRGKVVVDMVSS
jgi:D-arabinose 1-dehydrogenase-like Zn-dependent alcohol dehydrogenase